MLDTLLYSEVPGLVMMAFIMVLVYKMYGMVQRLDGRVQRLAEGFKERHREFKEHERVCADRWGQVQRELGAIHTAVGTPYPPISLKPPQPES